MEKTQKKTKENLKLKKHIKNTAESRRTAGKKRRRT